MNKPTCRKIHLEAKHIKNIIQILRELEDITKPLTELEESDNLFYKIYGFSARLMIEKFQYLLYLYVGQKGNMKKIRSEFVDYLKDEVTKIIDFDRFKKSTPKKTKDKDIIN